MVKNLNNSERMTCALPPFGLLALAVSITLYTLSRAELISVSPSVLGLVLVLCGAIQVNAGLNARRQGNQGGSTTLMPLGLFWLSLLGLYVFPALGLGSAPSVVAMTSYMTMWGLFAAILYLGSFRQSRMVQGLFGTLMGCLLCLGMAESSGNPVFFHSAAVAGGGCALIACYIGLAQLLNQRMQRNVMPLGRWHVRG